MATNGVEMYVSNPNSTQNGQPGNCRMYAGIAALKGDAPQRAEFTNTVGHAGSCHCHTCSVSRETLSDQELVNASQILSNQRTTFQLRRMQKELKQCQRNQQTQLRKKTGYAILQCQVSAL